MAFVEGALVDVHTARRVGTLKKIVRTGLIGLAQQELKKLASTIKRAHQQRNRGNGRAVVWVGTAFEAPAFRLLGRGGEEEPEAALAKLADAVASLKKLCEHLNDVLGASPPLCKGTVSNMMTIFSGLQDQFFKDNRKADFEGPGVFYFERDDFFEKFMEFHKHKADWSLRDHAGSCDKTATLKRPRTNAVAAVGARRAKVEVLAPQTTSAPNAVAQMALYLSVVKQERDAATQRANAAEDRLECCVCQDAAHQVILGPCRHLCCCATCAPALAECPICRTPVESRTTVFF